jgi:hypothetical protein
VHGRPSRISFGKVNCVNFMRVRNCLK